MGQGEISAPFFIMKYGELKNEIRDLGFEDDAIFIEYLSVIQNAITRACKILASTLKSPVGRIELDLTDESVKAEDGKYDLLELSKDTDGNVRFDSIDRIVEDVGTYIQNYLNYDLVEDHILVVPTNVSKKLIIYYNERIIPITDQTPDDYEIQVVYPFDPLVALLAAHYVWLDDDERKAILYWNEYDQLKAEIMAKAYRPKARIVGGF